MNREKAVNVAEPYTLKFKDQLDRANIQFRSEELSVGLIATSVVLWAIVVFVGHLNLFIAMISLPLISIIVFKLFGKWVSYMIGRRLSSFNNQFELVLRMMSSAIRAGLGLRQAMIMVTEEMADPAKHEFNLTVMQTNIGMSTTDALARLAVRMPSAEMDMFTRAISVQSQTGGNLGKTLDNLAQTIKERRKLFRKVKAITSEARASALVIGLLPIGVGAFVMSSQPQMAHDLLTTFKGHMVLGLAISLEVGGAMVLMRLLKFKV